MTPKTAFIKWSLIGSVVAGVLVIAQAVEVGGAAGLLQVGETSGLRPIIEEELGDVPLAELGGHDGHIFYAIGLDLNGGDVAAILDHGTYRYRRILYPLLASLGGVLNGYALLYGMIVVAVVSSGLAAGGVAALAARFERADWFALAVVLNPGVWLSVRLLTGDATALATMVLGLLGVVSSWRYTALFFTASGLAKDVYLMTPAGMMADSETRRWSLVAIPLISLTAWMTYLTLTIGDPLSGGQNLSWPLQGMVEASKSWSGFEQGDVLYLAFALLSVAIGLVHGLFRRSWLRWPILGWSILALISSNSVWDFGNNAARSFAPIIVLVAAAEVVRDRSLRVQDGPPNPPVFT